MKWTGLNELREMFLSFFEGKEHLRVQSASLIPQNDPSLLLINAGMAPLKQYFLGKQTPPSKRMASCQKCIRTLDIERVGLTSRHGTYFEMLGNFSFGDYFKHEATKWAWEFVTEVLDLPVDRLWVSIYLEDDEAFDIWTKEVGVDPGRIVRLGKEDNFWEHGSGPCGPCSEIYFDRGEACGCGNADCKVGCDCDRFVEFWNLVFTQFDGDGQGNYTPLAKPNIDTGMGLERLACIMQEVDSLFEVDTIRKIMDAVCDTAGLKYKEDRKTDVSLRIITDHIRSAVFMAGDGVTPSNEGRGYVLRRILRRAARHGKLIGINKTFLHTIADVVIDQNADAYPELTQKRDYILKLIVSEEENFARTLDKGMELLNAILDKAETHILTGEQAFKLYDTYGFPIELIREMIAERKVEVDEEGFAEHMKQQRERARKAREAMSGTSWDQEGADFSDVSITEFTGYDEALTEASLLAIDDDNGRNTQILPGIKAAFVFDKTPFYAESGGQAADTGIFTSGDTVIEITDVKKFADNYYLHLGQVVKGEAVCGMKGNLKIDVVRRNAIKRNHTAAHLLQKALQEVLGNHVHQAGQLVDDKRVRFDFNHLSAVTPKELEAVAQKVNSAILSSLPVNIFESSLEDARKIGAMALFTEKYGKTVRVVKIDGNSIELCGGTHVENTSEVGLFVILSESSVSAGIRRIEGVTGAGVLELIDSLNGLISNTCANLKLSNKDELPAKAAQLISENKESERKINDLNQKIAAQGFDNIAADMEKVKGCSVLATFLPDTDTASLRAMGDKLRDKYPDIIAVIGTVYNGKGNLLAVCGKDAVAKGAHAGKIVGETAAITGGKGGGRPDSAMAGAGDNAKIEEALAAVTDIVGKYLA